MSNKIMQSDQEIIINLEVFIIKEDKYYTAYSPALEISGYGSSIEKAKSSFETEVKIFLDETNKRGTLEKYLLKNGWKLQQTPVVNYEPPRTRTDRLLELLKSTPNPHVIEQQVIFPV